MARMDQEGAHSVCAGDGNDNYPQGMITGHVYYFLEDVNPLVTGQHPVKTPLFIKTDVC